ncbi:MAG: hypothetical protein HW378_1871 [Anaerolineales bacterium]|nr:hypothetical protein [Anaerolineales bacterium]
MTNDGPKDMPSARAVAEVISNAARRNSASLGMIRLETMPMLIAV